MKAKENIKILGINVDKVTKAEALDIFEGFLDTPGCKQIVTLNPEMLIEAQKNNKFHNLLNKQKLKRFNILREEYLKSHPMPKENIKPQNDTKSMANPKVNLKKDKK